MKLAKTANTLLILALAVRVGRAEAEVHPESLERYSGERTRRLPRT